MLWLPDAIWRNPFAVLQLVLMESISLLEWRMALSLCFESGMLQKLKIDTLLSLSSMFSNCFYKLYVYWHCSDHTWGDHLRFCFKLLILRVLRFFKCVCYMCSCCSITTHLKKYIGLFAKSGSVLRSVLL